jgi:hypothetical protein
MYNTTLRCDCATNVAVKKQLVLLNLRVHFVALSIQHAMCMHPIFICGCHALQYFSTLSHKQHNFPKNIIHHKMCVSSFSIYLLYLSISVQYHTYDDRLVHMLQYKFKYIQFNLSFKRSL